MSIASTLHALARRINCPFSLVKEYVPVDRGDIYDFGCGHGIFVNILAGSAKGQTRFSGFDIDKGKIESARSANKFKNVTFEVKDITEGLSLENAGCIILIDALARLSFGEQEKLLERCLCYLSDRGVLLIKEIDTRPLLKYLWTLFHETIVFRAFRLTCGKGLYYRNQSGFKLLLEKVGYSVNVIPIHKGYPYSHILYFCQKTKVYERKNTFIQSPFAA